MTIGSIFKYKLSLHLIIVLLLGIIPALNLSNAQNIPGLEKKLNGLKSSYTNEILLLDSLKQTLDKHAKEIDFAKKLDDRDEDNIKKMMASTVLIADRIDEQQKRVNSLEQEIEIVKKKLDEKYTKEIDSLSALQTSGDFSGRKEELHSRILTLTEKKVLVAPKIYSLSFSPEKIIKLNLSDAKTLEEKNVYGEYLREALTEVDNHLVRIKRLNEEASQIIALQEKTIKFLEDTEFDTEVRTSNIATSNSETARAEEVNDFFNADKLRGPQIQSFTFLLKQLNLNQSPDIQSDAGFSIDSVDKPSIRSKCLLLFVSRVMSW